MSSSRREFIGQLAGGSLVGLLAAKGVKGVKPAEAPVLAPPPRSSAPEGMSKGAARFIVTQVGVELDHANLFVVVLDAQEVHVEEGAGPKKPDLRIPPPASLSAFGQDERMEDQGIVAMDLRDEIELDRFLPPGRRSLEEAMAFARRTRQLSVRVAFDPSGKDPLAQKLCGVNAGDIIWIEVQGVEPL